MKILSFGSCNIDYVYGLDHIVAVGETEHSHRMDIFPGGKGLNQSIAIARAGAKVYHAGCVGSDGDMLMDTLTSSGVDVSLIKRVDEKNGHAIIQVSAKGENSIFIYAGSNGMMTDEFIDSVLSGFEKGDVIVLQNEINKLDYIIDRACDRGMCVVLNPSPIDEVIDRIDFSKISYVVLNEIEAEHISKNSEPRAFIEYMAKNYPELKIVLTLGDKGCMYHDSENDAYHPAFSVDVVDTTAAGDTFMGYFVASIGSGMSYADILERASAASAIAVSRLGASASIPTAAEVDAALEELKKKI